MKSNIIKYIFILFVIAIFLFAIYKIYYQQVTNEEQEKISVERNEESIITSLRIGISNFDNINPLISQNREVINLSSIIYEPLLSLTKDYKLEERLAKEWSKVNEKTYIVTLKSGLKWEDGTSITGGDIQFTVEKLKGGSSIYSVNVENISSVEIIDGLTVRINLLEQEDFFEYNLVFPIISSKQFKNEENFYESRIAPISSGMYKVKSANKDYMELVKNDEWHEKETVNNKIDYIKINLYASMGDVYNSFKIGNIDILSTSNTKISDYIGTIGFTTKEYKGRDLDFISLNSSKGVLANKEVRQAINYAIDKQKITSKVYENECYVSSFPLDYGSYLYEKEEESVYDQGKAKKVLEDAGWKYQYGKWVKNENYTTQTLYLSLVVDANNKERVNVAQMVIEQLEAIGIHVSLYQVSNANYKSYLTNKSYDMILTGISNGYSPNLSYFLGKNNIGNYKNAEIEEILDDLKGITDTDIIKERYSRIIEIYNDEIPYICLYRNKLKVVYSKKLIGEFEPNNYSAYYHIEKWYRQ